VVAFPRCDLREADAAFDRQWALTVLRSALDVLRAECDSNGRAELFEQSQPWLPGEAAHGDHADAATACGMSPAAFKMEAHRLVKIADFGIAKIVARHSNTGQAQDDLPFPQRA